MKIIRTPSTEDITPLTGVKLFCRIDGTAEDSLLQEMIKAAVQECERYTNRSVASQAVQLFLDRDEIPEMGEVDLPGGYVSAVSSVKLYGEDGSTATLTASSDYVTAIGADFGNRVVLLNPLPTLPRRVEALEVTYSAGQAAANVPPALALGIKQCVAFWYENRDQLGAVPHVAKNLWQRYRCIPVR